MKISYLGMEGKCPSNLLIDLSFLSFLLSEEEKLRVDENHERVLNLKTCRVMKKDANQNGIDDTGKTNILEIQDFWPSPPIDDMCPSN